MLRKGPKRPGKGTLIRGADGALYFIPDNKMRAFRLPNKDTADARAALDRQGVIAKKGQLPALHGSGLVCRTVADNIDVVLIRLAARGTRKPSSK
jgi:hypothetical protein